MRKSGLNKRQKSYEAILNLSPEFKKNYMDLLEDLGYVAKTLTFMGITNHCERLAEILNVCHSLNVILTIGSCQYSAFGQRVIQEHTLIVFRADTQFIFRHKKPGFFYR